MNLGAVLVMTSLLVIGCEKQQADNTRPSNTPVEPRGDARKRIPPDLLEILVDPGDKGSLDYVVDADGNEWLVNPRNGYRYPVDNGVPVMLLDEGAKHRNPNRMSQ
jgi:uncharacterized protein YbaR (Trm112 family)